MKKDVQTVFTKYAPYDRSKNEVKRYGVIETGGKTYLSVSQDTKLKQHQAVKMFDEEARKFSGNLTHVNGLG